jgi:hypothetical protein
MQLPRRADLGLSPALQLLVFLVSVTLVVSRRPDAILYPQFFAEDGSVWFREAYLFGWFTSLLHPRNGYFQTVPRLISAAALLIPFRFAPLLMNLAGITFQVLPVNFLLSARCANWGSLVTRALMAFLYLALPNSRELNAAVNEAQWHLAVLASLIVLARPASNLWGRLFDVIIQVLSGLSGPFGLILLPIAILFWWFSRERWRLVIIAVIAVCSALQLHALIISAAATRPHVVLGATLELFIQILAGQVYLAAILGQAGVQVRQAMPILVVAAVGGSIPIAYCLWKARLEWQLFIAFCLLIFAASLKTSTVTSTLPQWPVMRDAVGIRYWFLPMLAFSWSLVWCATVNGNGVFRFAGIVGLILSCFGIMQDWKYPAYPNFHFAKYANQLAAASPGILIAIPICPNGWSLQLVKRSAACPCVPIGSVDAPRPSAKFETSLPVAGWVMATEPVRRISIYIDRSRIASVAPDYARPDVDAIYPQSPDKNKGWAVTADTSMVAPGSHELEVRATTADGCEADIVRVPLERVP